MFVKVKPEINRRKLVQELERVGIRVSADEVADFLINTKPLVAKSHFSGERYRFDGWRYNFPTHIFEEVNPTLNNVEEL